MTELRRDWEVMYSEALSSSVELVAKDFHFERGEAGARAGLSVEGTISGVVLEGLPVCAAALDTEISASDPDRVGLGVFAESGVIGAYLLLRRLLVGLVEGEGGAVVRRSCSNTLLGRGARSARVVPIAAARLGGFKSVARELARPSGAEVGPREPLAETAEPEPDLQLLCISPD